MESELTVIAEMLTPTEAALLRERLEAEGNRTDEDNQDLVGLFGQTNVLGGVRVSVATAEAPRAKKIMTRTTQQAVEVSDLLETDDSLEAKRAGWTCPACGTSTQEEVDTRPTCG